MGAGLDAPQAALDGELDRPVVAQLEVQEAVVLGAAPVAAEQRVLPQHVEGAGDGAAVARRQHQDHAFGKAFAEALEERAGQVGVSPLAVARGDIALEERIPML